MIAAVLFTAAVLAAPPQPAHARATQLVQQLGDPSFKVREKAADDLIDLGSAAVDALRLGLKSTDIEIHDRCVKLLPKALDARVQEQIVEFLAEPDGPIPPDLPCIKRWVSIAGTGKASREMYAEIIKAHRKILVEVDQHPEKTAQTFTAFCQEVYNRQRAVPNLEARKEVVTYPDACLFLFLGSDPNARKGGAPVATNYTQSILMLNSPHTTGMLSGSGANESGKALFLGWLEQERYPTLVRRGFGIAATANLKEALPMVMRFVNDKTATPSIRSSALASSAKLFDRESLKLIEPLLKDDTLIAKTTINGSTASTEMRDVALGVSVQAMGQKPADYGFDRFKEANPAVGVVSTSNYVYALSDKAREAAFKKWQDWLDQNPK